MANRSNMDHIDKHICMNDENSNAARTFQHWGNFIASICNNTNLLYGNGEIPQAICKPERNNFKFSSVLEKSFGKTQ